MDVQGLGVELLTDVRCLSCGKVLAGRIGNEYDRLMAITLRDVNESIPPRMTPQERDTLALKFIKNRTSEIFQKLGIKRYCCMTSLQYKSQLLVGAPSPAENSIIDRQNMADKGMKRSVTRIDLSLPSRVPGNSGFSMVSLPGEEDHSPEWNVYMEKSRKDLTSPQFNYNPSATKLITTGARLPIGFNIKNTNVPIMNTGNSTPIKSKYLDMLSEPTYLGGVASGRDDMEIETVSAFSQMTISGNENIDGTNFRDIMDFEITAPGIPDDLNNQFF